MSKSGRVYSEYDKKYQAQPEQVRRRVSRNKARRMMIAIHGKKALKGKDIGHKKSLEKGGSTVPKNIKVQSRKTNRADKSMMKKK